MTNELMRTVDRWMKDHTFADDSGAVHTPQIRSVKPVSMLEGDGRRIARLDMSTGTVFIYVKRAYSAANAVYISFAPFCYYVLSHELGHMLYPLVKMDQPEEQFAHEFAIADCAMYDTHRSSYDDLNKLDTLVI